MRNEGYVTPKSDVLDHVLTDESGSNGSDASPSGGIGMGFSEDGTFSTIPLTRPPSPLLTEEEQAANLARLNDAMESVVNPGAGLHRTVRFLCLCICENSCFKRTIEVC